MIKQLVSLFKPKSDEEIARELFERGRPESMLEKNANGEYLEPPTQLEWDEFLTEYVRSTWW